MRVRRRRDPGFGLAAKGARALAIGGDYAPDDVKALPQRPPHRLRVKPEYYGEEGARPTALVERALGEVEVPKE